MAYLEKEDIHAAYTAACEDAEQWRIDYPEFERLADNGLMEDLDENLPEVNDGSLAAALFKQAKRVIKKKMGGRARNIDRNDEWLTELCNIYWEKRILPRAKAKASPRRKWKDAARKAAIFGGQPIITLLMDHGRTDGADFIVPYVYDVKLEAGKDSDADSDVIFWDTYYSKLQLENMIEDAKEENAEYAAEVKAAKADGREPTMQFNKWDVKKLEKILESAPEEQRPGNEQSNDEKNGSGAQKTGYHFYIAYQRGVEAPFYMCHEKTGDTVREWANTDPTGDVPVHYLYFYQDFKNPYGVGIVKLAGGTQNVLDYMRQADILATQLGIRPPKKIQGDEDEVDEDSLVWAQDANWYVGNANVEPVEVANGVYRDLPARMSMYQTSLQKFIPMGDSTISAGDSGDPLVGKTPQALKMAAGSLSIDDEDFEENVDECYAAVAASMINIEFANMQGKDLLNLSGEERDILAKAGIDFPVDAQGNPTNEFELFWDDVRGEFEFVLDPDADKETDDEKQLEGLVQTLDFIKDPVVQQMVANPMPIMVGSKKLDVGELLAAILSRTTDNDKILTDATTENQAQGQPGIAVDPTTGQPMPMPQQPGMQAPMQPGVPGQQPPVDPAMMQGGGQAVPAPQPMQQAPGAELQAQPQMGMPEQMPMGDIPMQEAGQDAIIGDMNGDGVLSPEERVIAGQISEMMEVYNVDPGIAAFMLEADRQGFEPEEIMEAVKRKTGQEIAPVGAPAPNEEVLA